MTDPIESLQAALGSRYDVLTHLGTGGMAEVYLARDTRHDRDVAVKVIRRDHAASMDNERFLREIRITAALSHPHIRSVLDSGEADDRPYYVMPFVRGETLSERLEREKVGLGLGLDDCLRIARELADALDYAHEHGVVHRDVKPSNVFLSAEGAVLSDFGIAIDAEAVDRTRLTDSKRPPGTVLYMSPERLQGQPQIDRRCDVYSLGCVLFEMLTLNTPYAASSDAAAMAKALFQPIPSAAWTRQDLPIEVEEIVERCLARTPTDRFQTAGALRDALDSARVAWKAGTSRGPALTVRGAQRPSRRRATVTAVVLAVLALAVSLVPWPTPPALDARKVVVFPLADRGRAPEGAGTGVAMMISNALTHADPLRAIDGWQRLSIEERQDAGLVTQQVALGISLASGAGHFLTGGVTSSADSVTVLLVLHDTDADSVIRQTSATGAITEFSPDQVGLRAMIELLPALLDPGREVDLSFLLQRDPGAIALWIQGDVEYRQARFTSALQHYGNAVAQDSLLGLAALMGAKTAIWRDEADLATELVQLALDSDSLLPLRHQHLAEGLAAYLGGSADRAIGEYRAALEDDPEWSDAWMLLGEVYQHLLPSDLQGVGEAEAAFSEAVRYDPGFVQPYVHLSEYSIRAGNLEEARERVARLRDSGAEGSTRVRVASLMLDCIEGGPFEQAWGAAAELDPGVVLEAAQQLAVGGVYVDCADGGFRKVFELPEVGSNRRWAAAMGLQALLVAQGRDGEAGRVLDAAEAAGITAALFMPMVNVWAGADMYTRAERVDSLANALWGETLEGVGPLTLWVLGAWKAHRRDAVSLAVIRTRLFEESVELGDAETTLMANAIDGHYALVQGDTARALEVFQALRSSGSGRHLFTAIPEPLAVERLLLAEILLKQGDPEVAYWTAAALDHPQPLIFSAFLPWSLQIRYRAALELPRQPWPERANEAFARLERLGRLDLIETN